jgi:hypothetical protein
MVQMTRSPPGQAHDAHVFAAAQVADQIARFALCP